MVPYNHRLENNVYSVLSTPPSFFAALGVQFRPGSARAVFRGQPLGEISGEQKMSETVEGDLVDTSWVERVTTTACIFNRRNTTTHIQHLQPDGYV